MKQHLYQLQQMFYMNSFVEKCDFFFSIIHAIANYFTTYIGVIKILPFYVIRISTKKTNFKIL